ncbi:MAG TPA: 2-dehydropantoate 2-reductase [Candidatus Acidoferrum sp.]|nr:2-dehydropantoate 2-reductase [Candidatus Acidoferrum sp.]
MRILVLGAGAIGGYFGARLVEAGADVTFLVRPRRAEALAKGGLRVVSPLGDVAIPVQTVTAGGVKRPFDLVLLACKAYDLDDALAAIAPAVGAESTVLPLLNGIAHIARLEERFAGASVLGGVAHVALALRPDGVIHQIGDRCAIRFGPLGGGSDRWSPALLEALKRARVDAVLSETIEQDMWNKLVFIAALAGMTCLMRASIGAILDTADGPALVEQLLSECIAVVTAEGFAPSQAGLAPYRAMLSARGSPITASMLRDIERGGPTEADHVLGDLVKRAASHDIAAPLLRVAYTHLQAHERRRAAGS